MDQEFIEIVRAREQPEERVVEHPEAKDHRLHRGVRLRQILSCLRHDRRRVIELGPGAGSRGGEIIFEGTPSQLLAAEQSVTGRYLREVE
jgi:hypothetical protein